MKKLLSSLCLLTAICFSTGLRSQQTWYFGDGGGMRFVSNAPSAFPQPAGTMSGGNAAGEGCSSLMDAANNVILFTNGISIWNGNGVLQGSPTYQLAGNSSSTQTVQIVPIPGTSGMGVQRVFIFTVREAEHAYGNGTATYGLRVSLATITGIAPNSTITIAPTDMNKLITPTNVLMSERLTVTRFFVDNTGKGGYWVLTHGVGAYTGTPNNTNGLVNNLSIVQPGESSFYAYHVSCETTTINDLDATEIVSTMPAPAIEPHRSWHHPSNGLVMNPLAQLNSQSQLKFSPNGTKVAVSLPWYGTTMGGSGWITNPICQLFDFDLNTGIVGTNHQVQFNLGFNTTDGLAKDGAAYGLEFSPNGNYIYVSSTHCSGALTPTSADGITSRIYRYTVSAWTPAGTGVFVPGSDIADEQNGSGSYAALQLGPDNRIYVAKQAGTSLSRIDFPNSSLISGVGFDDDAIPIAGTCRSGLPTSIQTANTATVPSISINNSCPGQSIIATGSFTGEAPSSYTWQLYTSNSSGNPVNSLGAVVSSISAAAFSYTSPSYSGSPSTFYFPGSNTLPCNKYYTARLTLGNGCGGTVTTQHTSYRYCAPTPVISGDMVTCPGGEVSLCVNYPGGGPGPQPVTTIAWSAGGGSASCADFTPTSNTTYTVAVTQYGCTGTATATVTMTPNYTNMSVSTNLASTNAQYYTAIATPIPDPQTIMNGDPTFGFAWTVRELDPVTNVVVPNSSVWNPNCWWSPTNANNFKGYVGGTYYGTGNNTGLGFNGPAGGPYTFPGPGLFENGHKYRIEYSTWSSTCSGVTANYIMYVCGGCRQGEGAEPEIVFDGLTPYNGPYQTAVDVSGNFNVFPNPSNGVFTMNFDGTNEKNIVVYDLMGKVVFEKTNSTDASLTLDLTNAAAGVYLVKVMTNGEIALKKIIKE